MEHTLSSYKIFKTVADEGSFLKAAEKLYITQPAISKAVKKLEDSLSVKLFIRESRGVRLTPDGELLYDYVTNAFSSIEAAENAIKSRHSLGIGQLRIGTSATLCKYVLLPYLTEFVSKNPHIQVSIQCQSTSDTISLLNSGTIDVGLVGITDESSVDRFYYLKESHYVFIATDTYLKTLKERSIISTKDIIEQGNIMLLDKQNVSRHHIERYFDESNLHPGNILEVNDMDLLIDFARISMGVACVIKEFVEEDLKTGTFKEIPLKKPVAPRKIGLATGKSTYNEESLMKFLNGCRII